MRDAFAGHILQGRAISCVLDYNLSQAILQARGTPLYSSQSPNTIGVTMKYIVLLALSVPALAMGQSLEETGTLHRWDYVDLVLGILSTMGGGAALAAYVPLKIQKAIPGVRMLINLVGQNFRNAKNSED